MAAFTKYSYRTHKHEPVAGTEDFVSVAHADTGGYSWSALGVYYSPERRRFFWLHDSGCSCNSYGESTESIDDFSNGSRDDAIRAAESIVHVPTKPSYGDDFTAEDRATVLRALRTFSESEAVARHEAEKVTA